MATTINADNGVSSGSAGLKSSADNSGVLQLLTNGTVALTVNTSQNVGIGVSTVATNFRTQFLGTAGSNTSAASSGTTQAASAVLRLQAGGGFTGTLDIGQGGGTGSWLQSTDTSNLATTYPLLLNPVGGNVGIGTSSPDIYSQGGKMLTVSNTATNSYAYTTLSGSGTGGGELDFGNQTIRHGAIASLTGSSLAFYTNSTNSGAAVTERARIDSSGNLLVGTTTTTPSAPFAGVLVAGAFRTIYAGGAVATGASSTLFTITVDSAYMVTVQTQNAGGLSTTAIVRYVTGGNPVATTTLYADNGAFAVSVSGTAVRITNNLGGTVVYAANIIRIF